MALTNDQILEAVSNMTAMEISELIKAMEEKFGVQAAAAVVAGPAAAGAADAASDAPTEFTVVLKASDPAKKIAAIKVVRELTGLGLKDAKDIVEGKNVNIKENVPVEEAKKMKEQLEAAGCQIELK